MEPYNTKRPKLVTAENKAMSDSRGNFASCNLITRQYLDVWDHACLLFHNFDWISSLQTFQNLEPLTFCDNIMAMLLLNIGILRCHLGHYTEAHSSFLRAVILWRATPISLFLLGFARYQLGSYRLAESAFESCADAIASSGKPFLKHRVVGLNFTIRASEARNNGLIARRMQESDNAQSRQHFVLHRLPAGVFFEDPRICPILAACSPRHSLEQRHSPSAKNANIICKVHLQNTTDLAISEASIVKGESFRRSPSTDPAVISSKSPTGARRSLEMTQQTSLWQRLRKKRSMKDSLRALSVGRGNLSAPSAITEQNSKPRNMEPRDARVRTIPIHDLASCIRNTKPASSEKPLRNLRGTSSREQNSPRTRSPPTPQDATFGSLNKQSSNTLHTSRYRDKNLTIKTALPSPLRVYEQSTKSTEAGVSCTHSASERSNMQQNMQTSPLLPGLEISVAPFARQRDIRSSSIYSRPVNGCYPWERSDSRSKGCITGPRIKAIKELSPLNSPSTSSFKTPANAYETTFDIDQVSGNKERPSPLYREVQQLVNQSGRVKSADSTLSNVAPSWRRDWGRADALRRLESQNNIDGMFYTKQPRC